MCYLSYSIGIIDLSKISNLSVCQVYTFFLGYFSPSEKEAGGGRAGKVVKGGVVDTLTFPAATWSSNNSSNQQVSAVQSGIQEPTQVSPVILESAVVRFTNIHSNTEKKFRNRLCGLKKQSGEKSALTENKYELRSATYNVKSGCIVKML